MKKSLRKERYMTLERLNICKAQTLKIDYIWDKAFTKNLGPVYIDIQTFFRIGEKSNRKTPLS